MRIIAISDSHTQNLHTKWTFPPCDVLIHAGDLTAVGQAAVFAEQAKKLGALPAWVILYVPGNHDRLAVSDPDKVREILGPRIRMLIDESVTINGIKFFGSPWLPIKNLAFPGFNRPSHWEHIPDDTDVLITHGPPYGILDEAQRKWVIMGTDAEGNIVKRENIEATIERTNEGDSGLANNVLYRVMPKIHVFGHIHEAYGSFRSGPTQFFNVSLVDRNYQPANQPTVIDLED